jgi:hypothetical protein
MISEKPKLLHELDWTHGSHKFRWARDVDPEIIRGAEVCGYAILEDAHGRYGIVPSNLDSRPHWFDLDPIAAQAVLIHIQQPSQPRSP